MNSYYYSFFKKSLLLLFLLGFVFSGCKRVVKSDDDEGGAIADVESVSKADYEKVTKLKLPLKTVSIDNTYSLNIPANSNFEVTKYDPKDEFAGMIGNIDLATLKTSFYDVALSNFFTSKEKLYSEDVFIIPHDDANFLTIDKIKKDGEQIENVYYEDENSIVFDQSDSFSAYTIHYDELKKCYIIYKAEMSWAKKFPKKEKIDLFMHFVKHGKSLTAKTFPMIKFSSWNEYVQNMPTLEIDYVNAVFGKLEKELKFFLEVDESVSPRTEGNYTFVELFNTSTEEALYFYKNIDIIKAGKVNDADYVSGKQILSLNSRDKYNLREDSGSYIVNQRYTTEEGKEKVINLTVFHPIDYKNKTYMLKTDTDLGESDVDFFVKMFGYFAKNYTLKI
ncbi:hypothetical protein EZJ43_01580 [Pedobacter changchengzhani]|uniref:Uncharacterized protein n=1 Tax=Pedobacter changchengzhani TaxID=2529274 RepID=A0A4R5MR19_9SPHI|nr:hypothetical protein [Pedobacter changchengzhani]TDG37809.1 hypothetical protein EZJ43_01580 [Pedobacter changchengzhani]